MRTDYLPIVNLNGTSLEELVRLRTETLDALRVVLVRLNEMSPHGRDYQTAPSSGSYRKAVLKHTGRQYVIEKLIREITKEVDHLLT